MAKKMRELVVKVGEYQDRNTGETKARWKNVGALMKNDEDDSLFIMLDKTFNPAGVPDDNGRASLLISCFKVKDDNRGSGQQGGPDQGGGSGGGYQNPPDGGGHGMADEIPF